jgi:hypothetical protein
MKKVYFLVLCALMYLSDLAAQDSVRFAISLGLHKSIIIPHRDSLKAPAKGAYPLSTEIDFSWLNYSRKGFEKANAYCKNGVALGYTDFGKPNILGYGYYFLLYTEPQITLNKRTDFSWTAGVGVIRLTDVYDFEKNSTNQFYSNPTSGLLRLGVTASFQVSTSWRLRTSIFYNHISNGGTRVPNMGMNFPTASLSLEYRFDKKTLPKHLPNSTFDPTIQWTVQLSTVTRLVRPWDDSSDRKRMIGAMITASKHFTHTNAWVVGAEASHDESLPATGAFFERYEEPTIASVLGGHQLGIGKVRFSQLLGIYVYKNYENSNIVFQRYVLTYEFMPHCQIGFSLKAHAEIAEMLDARLGITF